MGSTIASWPWPVWLAIAQLFALAFWGPLLKVRRWLLHSDAREDRKAHAELTRLLGEITRSADRIGDLEALVDLLRKALDKHLIRESAIASAADQLITLIELAPKLTPAMLAVRDRALRVLEDARVQLRRINEGGCA